jgi:hypothetical protein
MVNKVLKYFSKKEANEVMEASMNEITAEKRAFLETKEPVNNVKSFYIASSLQPFEDQKRILIMQFEAFTLFGALFLNA